MLRQKYGTVYVTFAPPISLDAALGGRKERFQQEDAATQEEKRRFIRKLGFRLLREVNDVAVAGATSLSSTVLLSAPQHAIRYGDFVAAGRALTSLLVARNVTLTASLQRNTGDFLESLRFLQSGKLDRVDEGQRRRHHLRAARQAHDPRLLQEQHHSLLPGAVARGACAAPWRVVGGAGGGGVVVARALPLGVRVARARRRGGGDRRGPGALRRRWRDRCGWRAAWQRSARVRRRNPGELPRKLLDRREDALRPARGGNLAEDGPRHHAEELSGAPAPRPGAEARGELADRLRERRAPPRRGGLHRAAAAWPRRQGSGRRAGAQVRGAGDPRAPPARESQHGRARPALGVADRDTGR